MKHIIITNAPDSQGHIGPFDTLAQAKSYGEKHLKGAYALMPLTTPTGLPETPMVSIQAADTKPTGATIKKNMSRREAIRATTKCCNIYGSGVKWQVCIPYRLDWPSGSITTKRTTSYHEAWQIATKWRAAVILVLMGYEKSEILGALSVHKSRWQHLSLSGYLDAYLTAKSRQHLSLSGYLDDYLAAKSAP